MDFGQMLSSPMTLIGLVGGSIFLVIYLRYSGGGSKGSDERKIQQTRAMVFLREQAFFEAASDSFDGLVSYGLGGFVEKASTSMFLYFGRPFSIFKQVSLSSKKRVGLYLVSIGNPVPMNPRDDNLESEELDEDRFKAMKQIAMAREVDRGKNEAAKKDMNETLMAITALCIGVIMAISWGIVIFLPLTGMVE